MQKQTSSVSTATIDLTDRIIAKQNANDQNQSAEPVMVSNYDTNQSFVSAGLKNASSVLIRAGAGITQGLAQNDGNIPKRDVNFKNSSIYTFDLPPEWESRQDRPRPGSSTLSFKTKAGDAGTVRYIKAGDYDDSRRAYNLAKRPDLDHISNMGLIFFRGSAFRQAWFRRDTCIFNNPRTGFLRYAQYVGYREAEEQGLFTVNDVGEKFFLIEGGTGNQFAWYQNSPLPPGMRYFEHSDIRNKYNPYVIDTQFAALYGSNDIAIEEEPGVARHNLIMSDNLNYEYYSNAGVNGVIVPNTLDDDSLWTGTCEDPLSWVDEWWNIYIDKDKLALWLAEHPNANLGSNS